MAEEKNDAAAAQEKDQAVATQPPCRCAAREEHPLKVPYAPGSVPSGFTGGSRFLSLRTLIIS